MARSAKAAISAASVESIFVRTDTQQEVWLKADAAMFPDAAAFTGSSGASATVSNVNLVASDGTVDTSAVLGWSTTGITGGGDFAITNANGFDYHSTNYWMLNSTFNPTKTNPVFRT